MKLNQIIQGDCLQELDKLPAGVVDVLITDPPFSSGARQTAQMRQRKGLARGDKWKNEWFGTDNLSSVGFMFFLRGVLLKSFEVMKEGGHVYSFIDWRNYPMLYQIFESAGFRVNNMIVWDKVNFGMGTNYRNQHELVIFASKGKPGKSYRLDVPNVLQEKRIMIEIHPTEKPVSLLKKLLTVSSVENDVILDPFCGSGSTCVAAKELGRNYIGIELNPQYVEIARKRIAETPTQLI